MDTMDVMHKRAEILESDFGLSPLDAVRLSYAMFVGLPVIIDGRRNIPTGKSTLCKYLRDCGINAKEAWELEEEKPDMTANGVCCYVWLGKEITY